MNATMAAPGPAALRMPGPDSDFGDPIEDDLVESSVSLAVQNPRPTVPEFAWPALGNWWKADSRKFYNAFEKPDACYRVECFRCAKVLCGKTRVSDPDRLSQAHECTFGYSSCAYCWKNNENCQLVSHSPSYWCFY